MSDDTDDVKVDATPPMKHWVKPQLTEVNVIDITFVQQNIGSDVQQDAVTSS